MQVKSYSKISRYINKIALLDASRNVHDRSRSNNVHAKSQTEGSQDIHGKTHSKVYKNIHEKTHSKVPQSIHKKTHSKVYQNIHDKALAVAGKYKKSEIELIDILEQVDRHKVYYKYGYRSMFQYVNEGLGLSHEVTSIFINVARKSREVPALKQEIKKGTITISKARRITSVLNQNNKDHWLALAKSVSKRTLEKEVAASSPKEAIREKMAYVHKNDEVTDKVRIMSLQKACDVKPQVRVQLQVGVSEKLMLQLRRVQDLVSQKQQKPARLEDSLELMAELYIKKYDPVERAKRQMIRGGLNDKNLLCPGTMNKNGELPKNGELHDSGELSESGKLHNNGELHDSGELSESGELHDSSELSENGELHKGSELSESGDKTSSRPGTKNSGSLLSTGSDKTSSRSSETNNGNQFLVDDRVRIDRSAKSHRKPLSAKTRHKLALKYQGQCSYINENRKRCGERKFLDIHHKVPLFKGGSDEIENLVLLCAGHHKIHHLRGGS